ncbi:MAG: hypothetical protein AAEJ46_06840 [Planctomycetota bacterium]
MLQLFLKEGDTKLLFESQASPQQMIQKLTVSWLLVEAFSIF